MIKGAAIQPLIRGIDLTVTKGGKPIIDRVSLAVNAGEIVTLVGPNGAGKSTLIRALLRLTECDTGRIERSPGLIVGYVPQFLEIDPTFPLDVCRFLLLGALAAGSPHADSITMAQGEKKSGGGMCCSAGDNGFCQNTVEATDYLRKETVP